MNGITVTDIWRFINLQRVVGKDVPDLSYEFVTDLVQFINNNTIVDVLFRTMEDGDIIALFPYEIEDMQGNVRIFQHVGQHGVANIEKVMNYSSPADKSEYAELYLELVAHYGYTLNILSEIDMEKYQEEVADAKKTYGV